MARRQKGAPLAIKQTLIAAAAELQLKIAQGLNIGTIHQRIHKLKQTGNIRIALRLVQQFLESKPRIGHNILTRVMHGLGKSAKGFCLKSD